MITLNFYNTERKNYKILVINATEINFLDMNYIDAVFVKAVINFKNGKEVFVRFDDVTASQFIDAVNQNSTIEFEAFEI